MIEQPGFMSLKKLGRKQSWPTSRYCHGVCLVGLRKTIKTSVTIVGIPTKIYTGHPSNRVRSITRYSLGKHGT
jgi:hypothetical protein